MATERLIFDIRATGTKTVRRDLSLLRREASATRRTLGFLRSALVVLASIQVAQGFIEMADTLTNVRNKLRLVTSSSEQLTAVETALFKTAQETRTSFESTVTLFTRMTRATQGLGLSYNELIGITKGVNQAIKISGATTEEAKNSIIQFGQGLASGALQGDELRSVAEQFPRLADAIGKEFGIAGGQLIAFAKANEGVLLTDRVIQGLKKSLEGLNEEFGKIDITVSDAFLKFGDQVRYFIGNVAQSVKLGAKLDTLLQAIAARLPEITVALLGLGTVLVFNVLADQVFALKRNLIGLAAFLLEPFIKMGVIILAGPVKAITILVRYLLLVDRTLKVLTSQQFGFALVKGIVSATVALSRFIGLSAGVSAIAYGFRVLTAAFITLRATMIGATVAGRAFLVVMYGFGAIIPIIAGLGAVFGRLLLTIFLNPYVLGFALVIFGIIRALLFLRQVFNDLLPYGEQVGGIFEVIAAAALTALDVTINSWRLFGPALADVFISAFNVVSQKITAFLNFFLKAINFMTGAINDVFGSDFAKIDLFEAFQFDNSRFEGKAAELADLITKTFKDRLARGGNVQEIKDKFASVLDFFKGFLPGELTADMREALNAVPELGGETGKFSKDAAEAQDAFANLIAELDPFEAGIQKINEAEATLSAVLGNSNEGLAKKAMYMNLLVRNIVGLGNAEFELGRKIDLVTEAVKRGNLSYLEGALAIRKLKVEAQGEFVSGLGGASPQAEAAQKLAEIQLFLDENQQRLVDSGLNVADIQQRMTREAFGLGETYDQVNEKIKILIANQEKLGLTTAQAEAEVRKLRIEYLDQQRDASSGVERAFLKLTDNATNAAAFMEQTFTDAFSAVEDAVVSFVQTGTFSFNEFFRNLSEQLLRLGTQQLLAGLFSSIGGAGGTGAGAGGFGGLIASAIFGAKDGAQFTVGANTSVDSLPGIDNRLVAFRAYDGETVTVTPKGQSPGGYTQINNINFNTSRQNAPSDISSQNQQAARLGAVLNRQRANR